MGRSCVLCLTLAWAWVLLICPTCIRSETDEEQAHENLLEEEDWGDGLKVLRIYIPESCEYQAKKSDIIHYHYVGRLAEDGSVFGQSFDYNTPYIVALGHQRIIPGMDRGLAGMCLWERRRVSFPPHLGYGSRGVGDTIPPNSSLVFYVRLIKIERNGHVLGEDSDILSIWNSGLDSYSDEKWHEAKDMMEEAVHLYTLYKNQTLSCMKKCLGEGDIDNILSKKKQKQLEETDPFIGQFLHYGVKGKCIRDCKGSNLPPKLRNPDPVLMEKFDRYVPYSYLHFIYYKLEEYEIAAKYCFSYLHLNPTDQLALGSAGFYRKHLNLTENDFIYQDSDIALYQEPYIKGKRTYNEKKWLESKDHFEDSLDNFKAALSDCYLMCEDVISVNLTQPDMNEIKKNLMEDYNFKTDTMEYYELIKAAIKQVLRCRDKCYYRVSYIEGYMVKGYLSLHFDHLQFLYYKLGNVNKAVESATTFLAMEPSSDAMTDNIRYYTSTYKLSIEDFVPREEYVSIHEDHEANERVLYFAEHDEMKKKEGLKGDTGEELNRQEL